MKESLGERHSVSTRNRRARLTLPRARMEFPCLARFKVMHLVNRVADRAPPGIEKPESDPRGVNPCRAHIGQRAHHLVAAGCHVTLHTIRANAHGVSQWLAGRRGHRRGGQAEAEQHQRDPTKTLQAPCI